MAQQTGLVEINYSFFLLTKLNAPKILKNLTKLKFPHVCHKKEVIEGEVIIPPLPSFGQEWQNRSINR